MHSVDDSAEMDSHTPSPVLAVDPRTDTLTWGLPGGVPAPVTGACISLTSRCNAACIICMENRVPGDRYDLPFEEAVALVDRFAGRVPIINSSASEALLYPWFLDFAREVRSRGSGAGVVTNGLPLARPGFLEACVDAGLAQVMISCHSPRPDTWSRLIGLPRGFDLFTRALGAIDRHNRRAGPEGALRVVVEVVITVPLLDELDDLFAFVDRHLSGSSPLFRIESFRPYNRASRSLDLQPSIDRIAGIVDRITSRHAATHDVVFRHVPLCLLGDHAHLADEVGQVLRREKVLGNPTVRSTEVVELMVPQNALEQIEWAGACRRCSHALVCPGVFDIPVPVGSPWPTPIQQPLDATAARLDPPMTDSSMDAVLPLIRQERDPACRPGFRGRPAFPDDVLPVLKALVEQFERDHPGADHRFGLDSLALGFPDSAQTGGRGRVGLAPEAAGTPHYTKAGDLVLTYGNALTPLTSRVLEYIREFVSARRRPGNATPDQEAAL